MDIGAFQERMAAIYGERDRERGTAATVAWLTEELGELAQAVRKGSAADQAHELGDVLARQVDGVSGRRRGARRSARR